MINREMLEIANQVCEKNKQLFKDIGISEFNKVCDQVQKSLYAMKLQEDYGISCVDRNSIGSCEPDVYVKLDNYISIMSMGEKYRRTISWSSDGSQPVDEVMLAISFPTGAYIFGDSYPVELFQEFWTELKSFDFKYVDDVNHCIYYPLDKASKIANLFKDILNKYYQKYRDEANNRQIAKLKLELERLEKESKT